MYCSKCGTQNQDDATFCNKCGNNLSSITERRGITGKLGKMGIPGFRSGKSWKMVLASLVYFTVGISLFVIIAAVIAAFVFGMGTTP
jgi:uncharacterized membrane protein YvbJ